MGKKRKKQQRPLPLSLPRFYRPNELPDGIPMPSAEEILALLGGVPLPRLTVADLVADQREMQGPNLGGIWSVECSKALVPGATERDGVIVAVPSARGVERARQCFPDSTLQSIAIVAVDAYQQQKAVALLDVEDAKKLVNALGEAIAAREALAR